MFQPMRRSEKEISKNRCYELLDTVEYGVLCLNGLDGYPYGVPLNFSRAKDTIYFHGATAGHKVKAIGNSAKSSLTVVGQCDVVPEQFDTMYESVILFGEIKLVEEEEERMKGFRSLLKKYSPQYEVEGEAYLEKAKKGAHIFQMTIHHMSGKLGR